MTKNEYLGYEWWLLPCNPPVRTHAMLVVDAKREIPEGLFNILGGRHNAYPKEWLCWGVYDHEAEGHAKQHAEKTIRALVALEMKT